MNSLFDFGDNVQLYPREVPEDMIELVKQYLVVEPSDITYDVASATFGSEYELADIDRNVKLPEGLTWDGKDQTVMNSNGIATDPSLDKDKRTCQFGGELNTKPCTSIDELVALYQSLLDVTKPTANNSCNLHNHMRIPGLDTLGLKRLMTYYYIYRTEIIKWSDTIPHPNEQGLSEFDVGPEYAALALDRYLHHTKSAHGTRHGDLPERAVRYKLAATTEEEFHTASVLGLDGVSKMKWSNANRAGLNLLQMRKSDTIEWANTPWVERPYAESGTIEFRMHHGTTDIEKYRNTLEWDYAIANAALNTGETPEQIFKKLHGNKKPSDVFPEYVAFQPELYHIFKSTKNDGSEKRRAEVREVIEQLRSTK